MIALRFKHRYRHAALLMGVWYAVCLHAVWTAALLADSSATQATAVSGPATLFPNRYGLALLLVVVAGCALVGIYMDKVNITKVMLLVPQQIMLGLSAFAGLHAMYLSHFADGVERSRAFLVADQVPAVIALLIHSATIVYLALLYERQPE